jgi:hypothetical protein
MATCRRVNVRMTTETKTTWERSVAVKESQDCPYSWLPDGLAPTPEIRKEQKIATEIRLELSEAEAHALVGLLEDRGGASGPAYDALKAVLGHGKDFATRRSGNDTVLWSLAADGHHPNCSRHEICPGEGQCK